MDNNTCMEESEHAKRRQPVNGSQRVDGSCPACKCITIHNRLIIHDIYVNAVLRRCEYVFEHNICDMSMGLAPELAVVSSGSHGRWTQNIRTDIEDHLRLLGDVVI